MENRLEQLINNNPDRADSYLVCADALLERGDWLGELIMLGFAVDEGRLPDDELSKYESLQKRAQEELLQHLHGGRIFKIEWRMGMPRQLEATSNGTLTDTLVGLNGCRLTVGLKSLHLKTTSQRAEQLDRVHARPALRHLILEGLGARLVLPKALFSAFPNLLHLELVAHEVDGWASLLGERSFKRLRTLDLTQVRDFPCGVVASAFNRQLRKLDQLVLQQRHIEDDPEALLGLNVVEEGGESPIDLDVFLVEQQRRRQPGPNERFRYRSASTLSSNQVILFVLPVALLFILFCALGRSNRRSTTDFYDDYHLADSTMKMIAKEVGGVLPEDIHHERWISLGNIEVWSSKSRIDFRIGIGRASDVGVDSELMWAFLNDPAIGQQFHFRELSREGDIFNYSKTEYLSKQTPSAVASSAGRLERMAEPWRQWLFACVAEIGLGRSEPVPIWYVNQEMDKRLAKVHAVLDKHSKLQERYEHPTPEIWVEEGYGNWEPCSKVDPAPTSFWTGQVNSRGAGGSP